MAPSGDGVLDVDVSVPVEKVEIMASEVDATIRLAMDQSFAGSQAALSAGFSAGATRANNAANFISETTQLVHQGSMQLIGAKAAGQLDRDALAKGVLDARSAAGQPGNAPSGA